MTDLYFLGDWRVNDVKPSATGDAQEVKVKVRINHNGILLISSAQMVEKKEVEVDEAQKQEQSQNGMETDQPQSPGDAPTAATTDGQPQEPMEVQEVSCNFNVVKLTRNAFHELH